MSKTSEGLKPNVMEEGQVNVSDWGDIIRIDLNNLGARVPETLEEESVAAWKEKQNEAICETMQSFAANYGGDFNSFAEWTVTGGPLYDGKSMRDVRKSLFADNYRAAITTCKYSAEDSDWATRIQATAFIPKSGNVKFSQIGWEPDSLYSTEFMALSPAVTTEFDGVKLLHLSGVVAWNKQRDILFRDDPRNQIRHVLEKITAAFEEAGGSKEDICRIRPFTQSAEMSALVREEVDHYWSGTSLPVVMNADRWNVDDLVTEIQVCGLIGVDRIVKHEEVEHALHDEKHARIRRSSYGQRELIHIGEIRAEEGTEDPGDEVRQVLRQIGDVMQSLSVTGEEVNLAMVYAGTKEVIRLFHQSAADVLPAQKVHIVPCGIIQEMGGRQLKVELTINRIKP